MFNYIGKLKINLRPTFFYPYGFNLRIYSTNYLDKILINLKLGIHAGVIFFVQLLCVYIKKIKNYVFIGIFLNMLFLNNALAVTADASIFLKLENITEKELTISINVENPSKQQIISVQSWLKYDPSILKGINKEYDGNPFNFVAPGEDAFDEKLGIVKIGRSSISGGVNEEKIFIANLTFERISLDSTEISFYNFKLDHSGNTSVRVFKEGFPVNILKETPAVLTIEEQGEKNIAEPVIVEKTSTKDLSLATVEKKEEVTIVRPQNLRISSGPEYVILSWDPLPEVKGYTIYYSNRSGRYIRKRYVGNVTDYYLDNLLTGEYYYFAITAYDLNDNETEYSDEVRIKVGYPETSSSPLLISSSGDIVSNVTKHVDTGPATLLLLAILGGGILSFYFVKRKEICYN